MIITKIAFNVEDAYLKGRRPELQEEQSYLFIEGRGKDGELYEQAFLIRDEVPLTAKDFISLGHGLIEATERQGL